MAVMKVEVAEVVAVGALPISSGVHKAVAEEVVAGVESRSVGSEEDKNEIVNSKIVVRLPGDRKRRIVVKEGVRVEDTEIERVLIAPLGPRAIRGGLIMKVGKELVFAGVDSEQVAGSDPAPATIRVSQGTDARHQSPGASGVSR